MLLKLRPNATKLVGPQAGTPKDEEGDDTLHDPLAAADLQQHTKPPEDPKLPGGPPSDGTPTTPPTGGEDPNTPQGTTNPPGQTTPGQTAPGQTAPGQTTPQQTAPGTPNTGGTPSEITPGSTTPVMGSPTTKGSAAESANSGVLQGKGTPVPIGNQPTPTEPSAKDGPKDDAKEPTQEQPKEQLPAGTTPGTTTPVLPTEPGSGTPDVAPTQEQTPPEGQNDTKAEQKPPAKEPAGKDGGKTEEVKKGQGGGGGTEVKGDGEGGPLKTDEKGKKDPQQEDVSDTDPDVTVVDSTVGGGETGGGGEMTLLGPSGTPQLGVSPFDVPTVPKVDPGKAKAIQDQTGKTLEQHRSMIQGEVARLTAYAQQLQADAVAKTAAAANDLKSFLDSGHASILSAVEQARGGITASIAEARGKAAAAASAAYGAIKAGEARALGAIASAATTATDRAVKYYEKQSKRYADMGDELFKPFNTLISEYHDKTHKDGEAKTNAFTSLNTSQAVGVGQGNALEQFINKARAEWIAKDHQKAINDMCKGVDARQAEMKGQEKPIRDNIAQLLAPLSTRVKSLGDEGKAAVAAAKKSAETKLAADAAAARKTVGAALVGVNKHFDGIQTQATGDLDGIAANANAQVEQRKQAADGAMQGAGARFADQYRTYLENAKARFPKEGPITLDAVTSFFIDGKKGLDDIHLQQITELDRLSGETRSRFNDAIQAAIGSVTTLQQSSITELVTVGDAQSGAFAELSGGFVGALGELGPSVSKALDAWLAPVQAQLSAHEADVKKRNELVRSTLSKTLGDAHSAWLGTLQSTITSYLDGAVAKSHEGARPAREKVEDRAKRCFQAMRGMGTDENKLFDALRAMVALEPGATSFVFSQISGGESLTGWMRDELNDEEYGIAMAHYGLDHGAAARMEIAYNVSFWGDDEAQIEKILRGMPEDERKKIQGENKKEWESTLKLLNDNLDGNDLKVVDALAANNVSKADAIRLKEKVDKARMEGDNDALHEALEGMDQEKIDDIATEFAKLDGVGANTPPPDAKAAREEMAKYVTDPRKKFVGRGQVDMKLDQGSADLANALIMSGNDSVDTRVARFKREMDRPGGPNDEKLEKALYLSGGLKDAMHDPDPEKRKAAQEEAKKQQEEFAKKYQDKYKTDPTAVINGNKNVGADKKDLFQNMLRDGYNSPEVAAKQIKIAVTGAGTDEDAIKRALGGMNKNEIADLKTKYAELPGGGDLEDALGVNGKGGFFTELSGQDRIDVEIALMGDEKFMNDDERMALAEKKYDVQRGSGSTGFGRWMMDGTYEQKGLDQNMKDLRDFRATNKDKFKDGKFAGTPAEYEEYRAKCRLVGITADLYQEQTDRVANYVTTGIAIAGAVAGAILSGGTAAPMLIAGVTGLMSAGANYGMKGGRYGWEQGVTDLAVTGVNVATAGIGAKLTGGIDKAFEAGKITTGSMIVQKGLSSGGMNAINSMAQTGFNDATWKKGIGNGIGETFYSGGKGFATGFASTVATEGLTKFDFGKRGLADNSGKGTIENLLSPDKAVGWSKYGGVNKALTTGRVAGVKSMMGAVNNTVSKSTDIAFDKVAGRYQGELWNAGEEIGGEALKGLGQGALEGTASVVGKPVTDWYTKKREQWAEKRQKKQEEAQNQSAQSQQVQQQSQQELQKLQQTEQQKLQSHLEEANNAKVTLNGEEKVDANKAPHEEEVHDDVEQTKKVIEQAEEHHEQVVQDEQKKVQVKQDGAEDASNEEKKNLQTPHDEQTDDVVVPVVPHTEEGGDANPPKGPGKTTQKEFSENELLDQLMMLQKRGIIKYEDASMLIDKGPEAIKSFLHDEQSLQRIIALQQKGVLADHDVTQLLDADPHERQKTIEQLEYDQHLQSEKYPKSLHEAKAQGDPVKKQALIDDTIGAFDKGGQGAAVDALKRLAGNPDAQIELAHHLAIYFNIIAKPTRQISDLELVSLVRAHGALMESTDANDAMLRKFITPQGAENYANNGKYSNSVKGCVGDAKNTTGLNPEEVAHVLGLDYNDDTYVTKQTDGSYKAKGDEAFYIEFAQTQDIRDKAKVTVASDLLHRIEQLAKTDPVAAKVMTRMVGKDMFHGDINNPYTGTGGTAAGNRLGVGSKGTVNQEMDMFTPSTLPPGTKLYRMDEKGQSVVYAEFDGTKWVKTAEAGTDARFKGKDDPGNTKPDPTKTTEEQNTTPVKTTDGTSTDDGTTPKLVTPTVEDGGDLVPGTAAHKEQRWKDYLVDHPNADYAKWSKQYDVVMANHAKGQITEKEALQDLGLGTNNEGSPQTFTHQDGPTGKKVTTRPDSVTEDAVVDIKSLTAPKEEGGEAVLYLDAQMRAQRAMATAQGKDLVVIVVSDDPTKVRPSGPMGDVAKGGADAIFLKATGTQPPQWYRWNPQKGTWEASSQAEATTMAGGLPKAK